MQLPATCLCDGLLRSIAQCRQTTIRRQCQVELGLQGSDRPAMSLDVYAAASLLIFHRNAGWKCISLKHPTLTGGRTRGGGGRGGGE